MNKLNKDLLFYSNYCLHSNTLINSISKTHLHEKMIYICIDEKKVKVPSFITRVPTIYLVKEKKILVEDDIDRWFEQKNRAGSQKMPQQQQMPQYQQQMPQQQRQMPQQQRQMPQQQRQMPQQQQHIQQQKKEENIGNDEILGYHMNEMSGTSMSNSYSFISDDNSSLNHNFEFLDGSTNTDTRINTPKEFSKNEGVKSKLDTDFDSLMASRNNESFSKGIERV